LRRNSLQKKEQRRRRQGRRIANCNCKMKHGDPLLKSRIYFSLKFSLLLIVFMSTILNLRIVEKPTKPVMYTFQQKGSEEDIDLLQLWEEEWSRAGFDTKILTLGDAKKHPYFKEMRKIVNPTFGDDVNAMMFYRWLAMASAGGGWLAQSDTFPTNFPVQEGFLGNLPENGKLSSWQSDVPALLSGSAKEWTRVSRLLMDAFARVDGAKAETLLLQTLKGEDSANSTVQFLSNFNVQVGLVYQSPRKVDCRKMGAGRAVHMAHPYIEMSFKNKLFPIEITESGPAIDYRSDAVRIFMEDWRYQCGGSNVLERR